MKKRSKKIEGDILEIKVSSMANWPRWAKAQQKRDKRLLKMIGNINKELITCTF